MGLCTIHLMMNYDLTSVSVVGCIELVDVFIPDIYVHT